MAGLKEQLKTDLTAAMRAQDELVRATLRMALTAVHNEEVAGKVARELSDDEVVAVLTREAKKRREAAAAYRDAGAPARAEREVAEGTVLERYLPAQLGDAALAELVVEAVAATGAQSQRDLGAVMKELGPKVAGRADGSRVAAAVRAVLAS